MNVPDIKDAVAQSRFEWMVDGHLTVVNYRREGSVLILTYAGVPAALGGRGIGSQLVDGVLALVRARGETVIPECSFIVRHIARHPQYADLVATR
jgi:predicted GNAT family acetyltransferase